MTARALPVRALQVIHRPANALKELLENSIDAGSTNISVVAKAGGLKMLQVAAAGVQRAPVVHGGSSRPRVTRRWLSCKPRMR